MTCFPVVEDVPAVAVVVVIFERELAPRLLEEVFIFKKCSLMYNGVDFYYSRKFWDGLKVSLNSILGLGKSLFSNLFLRSSVLLTLIAFVNKKRKVKTRVIYIFCMITIHYRTIFDFLFVTIWYTTAVVQEKIRMFGKVNVWLHKHMVSKVERLWDKAFMVNVRSLLHNKEQSLYIIYFVYFHLISWTEIFIFYH